MLKIHRGKSGDTKGLWIHTQTKEGHNEKFHAYPIEIENNHLVINSRMFYDGFYCITCAIKRLLHIKSKKHETPIHPLEALERLGTALTKYQQAKQEPIMVDE